MLKFRRLRRRFLSEIGLARGLILGVFVLLLILIIPLLVKGYLLVKSYSGSSLLQASGRTNFLILGISGPGHDGPNMTDTIIFASLKPATREITLLSIPRDLWVSSLHTKINATYSLGEDHQPGDGILLAKSSVSELLGQPIHYALVFDFNTFVQIIDTLGGVDINVANSFTDTKYPIPGKEDAICPGDPTQACRYEVLTFTQGLQHMDGSTALKYSRSRQSEDPAEGNDFARSRRQQQVISALKTKLISTRDPRLLYSLYNLISQKIVTDISPQTYFSLGKSAFSLKSSTLKSFSLNDPDQLYHPPLSAKYDNQWILLPKGDNPKTITDFVSGLLN